MGKVVAMKAPEYQFSRLGMAVMSALDEETLSVREIARIVEEPECVVAAMLEHLEQDGMVNEAAPAKSKPRARR